MKRFIKKFNEEGLNLLIVKNGEIVFLSKSEGIKPLLEAIARISKRKLSDSVVIDRIVGRAAALLIALIRAKKVFTDMISKHAINVFKRYGISFESKNIVEEIRNKSNTDMCPFEKMVLSINDPKEGFQKLNQFFIQ